MKLLRSILTGGLVLGAGVAVDLHGATSAHSGNVDAIVSNGTSVVLVWWHPPDSYLVEASHDLVNWYPLGTGTMSGTGTPLVWLFDNWGQFSAYTYWRISAVSAPSAKKGLTAPVQ